MSAAARLTYVGHATVLLDLDGVRLLTDPVLRPRVLHLRRSGAVHAETLERIDAVLVSHAHWDHLDLGSLARLPRNVRLVVPRGVGRLLGRRGFGNVVELDVAGRADVGPLAISATRAEHDGRRGPFGVDAPALGYVVAGSRRVYFAGDTDLYPEMSELAPLDLALLPVAGWGPRLPPGHLDPRRAAEALALLRPRAAVPIHWGTYSVMTLRPSKPAPAREPADEFARLASELAPDVRVHVLSPGETLELE
jgi:L-ascorbate metabolism protein UlaG (beta-lactamase superfamily)